MKLELKHLAPYLPYSLKIKTGNLIREMIPCDIHNSKYTSIDNIIQGIGHKPILRPLSDLIAFINIDFEDEKFKPVDVIIRKGGCNTAVGLHVKIGKGTLGFKYFDLLIQWHFDVFGLIEKGLAIDINTI